jgi:hypothetical protein
MNLQMWIGLAGSVHSIAPVRAVLRDLVEDEDIGV